MARKEAQEKEFAFRVYAADCLKVITENTARLSGGGYMNIRLIDVLHPKPEETRSSDDVIAHMKQILGGLEVVE